MGRNNLFVIWHFNFKWESYTKTDCTVQYSLVHGLEGSSKVFGIKPTRGVESVGSMKT